jgi:excinuclease UvrABC nuclease subunit
MLAGTSSVKRGVKQMLENIELKDFPKSSGVYFFKDVKGEIIYVGSSKDLYMRMGQHRACIKKGSNNDSKTDLYQFLQTNQFTVEFTLQEDFRQLEQKLIEQYNPKFNQRKAFTDCKTRKEYTKQYYESHREELKQYYETHKEEKKQYDKQYYESNKEKYKQYYESHIDEIRQQHSDYYESHINKYEERRDKYNNQKCNYNGEILNLPTLARRFKKAGIIHSFAEARKYLIQAS